MADLVTDQNAVTPEPGQLRCCGFAAGVGLLEASDPARRGVEENPVAVFSGLNAQRDAEMGLAGAWPAEPLPTFRCCFPDGRKRVSDEYETPAFALVLRSMKTNRHFTLQQGWRKYVSVGGRAKKYGYAQLTALTEIPQFCSLKFPTPGRFRS